MRLYETKMSFEILNGAELRRVIEIIKIHVKLPLETNKVFSISHMDGG